MLAVTTAGYAQYVPLPKLKPLSEKKMLEPIMPLEKNGRWGYANSKCKFLIKNVFDAAEPFERGVARVCYGGKWGLLAANGTFLLNPAFDEILPFNEDQLYTLVRSGDKWGTINATGTILTPATCDEIGPRQGFDVIIVEKGGLFGALGTDGAIEIEPTYSELGRFNGAYAIVTCDMKMGTVDGQLRPIIPTDYEDICPFRSGLLKTTLNGHEGLCTELGKEVVAHEYEKLRVANNGYVITENYGKFGILQIGRKNNVEVVVKPVMDRRPDLSRFPVALMHEGNFSIINATNYETFALPERVNGTLNADMNLPADSDYVSKYPVGNRYILYTVNDAPAYILDSNDNCVWAVNSSIRDYALSPISNKLFTTNFKKEVMQRGYDEGVQVYSTLTFDVDWPVNAGDKRVGIAPLQETVAGDLADFINEHMYGGKGSTPDNPNLDNVKSFFFNSFTGPVVKAIPASVDYEKRRENSVGMTLVESEVKGCVRFDFESYGYWGGAHGGAYIEHHYYKLETGRRVSLSDMFTYEQRSKMLSIVRSRPIDEDGNLIDSDEIQYNEVESLPDNFIIKDNVIYFQFQQYDIAAYAVGSPLLGVRLSEVR